MKKKIVVIGSGIGGSGVAALLQHKGFEVTVLEKNNFFGGKCYSYDKDGFIVDCGVHMISCGDSGPLLEISRQIGGNIRWLKKRKAVMFKLGKSNIGYYQPVFYDPRTALNLFFAFATSPGKPRTKPSSAQSLSAKRVKGLSDALYKRLKLGGGLAGAIELVFKLFLTNEALINDLDEISAGEFLHSFTDDIFLHQFFAYISMIFFCTTYDRVSAGEFLWSFIKQLRAGGLGVPEGGARSIPSQYLNCMKRDGGKLVLGAKVKKIEIDSGKVKSVLTEDGKEYKADYVISNAGIKLTLDMAGEKNFPVEFVNRIKGLEYSYSFITAKYGLSQRAVKASGVPCILNIPDMEPDKMYEYLKTGEAPADPHLFIPMQTEWDKTSAPKGKQLVVVGVLGPVTATEKDKEHCKIILDRAEEKFASEFPGFQKYVEWSTRTDNSYYSNITGKPTADCIGLAQIVGQTGAHKPHPKMPVEGLYLVGCDAGARGVGTEQAAASALNVANMIV